MDSTIQHYCKALRRGPLARRWGTILLMKKGFFFGYVVFFSLLLIGSPAMGKGEKKGWQSDVPPGQEKKQVVGEEKGVDNAEEKGE
jgi:hypothetical protein